MKEIRLLTREKEKLHVVTQRVKLVGETHSDYLWFTSRLKGFYLLIRGKHTEILGIMVPRPGTGKLLVVMFSTFDQRVHLFCGVTRHKSVQVRGDGVILGLCKYRKSEFILVMK
jgi:hypothetical protein